MSKMNDSLLNIRLLDDFALKKTAIHCIHPLAKLITTAIYLVVVISFGKYDMSGLLPMTFYPVIVFALAEIPVAPILKRVLVVEPLIIGIGIMNPFFDKHTFMLGGVILSQGWITFLVIFFKCGLTVVACLLLVATTRMEELGVALRMLKVPKIFVLQLLLTYRYISILTEEVFRMHRAYLLRAPGQKGIKRNVWGSFAGQLLLRTFDRAQQVYLSMSLRGFDGEYHTGEKQAFQSKDLVYAGSWLTFLIAARMYNLPELLGIIVTGVNK